MSLFDEENWKILVESYSKRDMPSRELKSNPPSEKELAKIMLMHPEYNKFIKNEIEKVADDLGENSKAREGLEEIMKNYSDVKTLTDNTGEKSRVIAPILVAGTVLLGSLVTGGAIAAVGGWIRDKW
jgi:hypothetical protein